jgi:hypothetical protein
VIVVKNNKNKNTAVREVVFNPEFYYNVLFFSVFNITIMEKIVNVKYSTKNNIINVISVFLRIKNHPRAITSSDRNLKLVLTSV